MRVSRKNQNGSLACVVAFLFAISATAEPWTLENATRHALANNPDARMARSRIASATAALDQAGAAFWPQVQLQSSYLRTDNPMMVFGSILNQRAFPDALNFNDVPDTDNLNTKGLVRVPLYAGGKNKAAREAAKSTTLATREDAKAIRNDLAFEVARGFYTIVKTREFIRAAEATVAAYDTNISVAQKRLSAGSLLRNDLLDLQVRAAQAREDLVRARNANALAVRGLRDLMGIEDGDFSIVEDQPEPREPNPAFSRRPEVAAAEHRQAAAEDMVRKAKSGFLPRLSAFASVDYDYGWKFDHGGASYTAGGLLEWDLWDGNATRARVREARANMDIAREEERKVRLAIDLETEQARLAIRAANERLLVMDQTVSQASESVGLTRARFEQGAALPSQLMDAETALLGARVRQAEAKSDRRIALMALRKALGFAAPDSQPE